MASLNTQRASKGLSEALSSPSPVTHSSQPVSKAEVLQLSDHLRGFLRTCSCAPGGHKGTWHKMKNINITVGVILDIFLSTILRSAEVCKLLREMLEQLRLREVTGRSFLCKGLSMAPISTLLCLCQESSSLWFLNPCCVLPPLVVPTS